MKPAVATCVCLNVPSLAAKRRTGSIDTPRSVRWDFNHPYADLGPRVALYHDNKAYTIPLVPYGGLGGWAVHCPTCGARSLKLWLAPHRFVFQCRLCAGVQTWHQVGDRKLHDIGVLAGRIARLRRRYHPVAFQRPTPRWYRAQARIVALEDRLEALASSYVEARA